MLSIQDQTEVYHIAGWFFTSWATREAQDLHGTMECGRMPYFYVAVQWSVTILFLWTKKKLLFFQSILKQNLQVNERIIIPLKLRLPVCLCNLNLKLNVNYDRYKW